jgi:hypothetical protein
VGFDEIPDLRRKPIDNLVVVTLAAAASLPSHSIAKASKVPAGAVTGSCRTTEKVSSRASKSDRAMNFTWWPTLSGHSLRSSLTASSR